MSGPSRPEKQLVVLTRPRLHSRPPQITQRLLLHERMLTKEIRELEHERKKIRARIHYALDHGAKCEPGFRSAAIITRHVLQIL